MNIGIILLGVLAVVISGLSLFTASNINKKLVRLRRRYDFLLRGHGDINLEELVVSHGKEIEELYQMKTELDASLQKMDKQVREGRGSMLEDLSGRLDSLDRRLTDEMSNFNTNVNSHLKRVDERVYAQLDSLEKKLTESLSQEEATRNQLYGQLQQSTQDQLQALDRKSTASLQEEREKFIRTIHKNEEDTYLRFNTVNESLTKQQEETKQAFLDFDQTTKSWVQSDLGRMADQLSLSVQTVLLSRYNAFEGLTGDSSFSLLLLDEHRSGVILSSIYGRKDSAMFAKAIQNGQAQQDLSPEEAELLAKVVDHK